jgi:YbbR domain-containing protein
MGDTLLYILSFKWLITAVRYCVIGLRNFFSTRVLLKFMSLVLGTLLYFAISASHVTTTSEYVVVRPQFTGIEDGYELLSTDIRSEPRQVLVKGRIAVLNRLQYLQTKPISLSGRGASTEILEGVEVDLVNLPNFEKPVHKGQISAEPAVVNVHIAIVSKWKESMITKVPIRFMAPPDYPYQVTIEPTEMDVHVSARQEILDNLSYNSVKLYIESSVIKDLTEKEFIPEIVLPPGVRLRSPLQSVMVTQLGPLEPLDETPPELEE